MLAHVGYLKLLYQLQKFMKGKISDSADDTLSRITESSANTASISDETKARISQIHLPVHPTLAMNMKWAKQIYL
jgi:hypothetical protein